MMAENEIILLRRFAKNGREVDLDRRTEHQGIR